MRPAGKGFLALLHCLAYATAGVRARLVLRALEGKVMLTEKEPGSVLRFDETRGRIYELVYGTERGPYQMIHEFGHAYHCYYWPFESAYMVPVPHARAEAVALLFELELQTWAAERWVHKPPVGQPQLTYLATSTWKVRAAQLQALRAKHPEPFDKIEQIGHRAPLDFHALVETLVRGQDPVRNGD